MSMPVFISCPMPHSCSSLSAPPWVTSVLTITSGKLSWLGLGLGVGVGVGLG